MTLHLGNSGRKDNFKDSKLADLVRLCGKSLLYLPTEYAPCPLVLPTCLRATAQHLVQQGKQGKIQVIRVEILSWLTLYSQHSRHISSTWCCTNCRYTLRLLLHWQGYRGDRSDHPSPYPSFSYQIQCPRCGIYLQETLIWSTGRYSWITICSRLLRCYTQSARLRS